MNIFDIGIVLLLIMFFITGFKRGVIKELASLIGIILVFVLSYYLKGMVGNLLCFVFPFFKFAGSIEGLTVLNIVFYQAIAFLLVFGILLSLYVIILKISKVIQKLVNMTIILWLPSKILGGIVAIIEGWIILFLIFLMLLVPLKNQSVFYDSSLVNKILYKTPVLSNSTSTFVNSVTEIYELGEAVSNNSISKNEANLKGIDIVLKYKIASKGMIEKLVELHKLDNISNIDSVLNNY